MKSIRYKLALAITIIRNKPDDLSLDEFVSLLRANFTETTQYQNQLIQELKFSLLEAKREIFYLKNEISADAQVEESQQANDFKASLNFNANKLATLKRHFCQNVDFISNVIKLKQLDKESLKLSDADRDTIFQCLDSLLDQIHTFLFECGSFYNELTENNHESLHFPVETILHSMQVFLNIFEIEWFYYLRNQLIDKLLSLIDNIVKSIIQYQSPCNQVLFILYFLS